ncbi:sarcocystatin-A [Drosophila grimshawi]|uniref:GH14131 n=1 Tax=Drosophila grimshawi TaxID=7222 RepID=B4JXX9_DROGR|nr:sarcocystatin-A [Drosophila grimshawi]EDV90541.1 GH14131 [Drosophila grimshawi]
MFSLKLLFILGLAMTAVDSLRIRGRPKELSGDELQKAEDTLNISLAKLAEGDGPNYQLIQIISASYQLVAGSKYVYVAELADESNSKVCNVEILSRPWLEDGTRVTFDCPDGKIEKQHSS